MSRIVELGLGQRAGHAVVQEHRPKVLEHVRAQEVRHQSRHLLAVGRGHRRMAEPGHGDPRTEVGHDVPFGHRRRRLVGRHVDQLTLAGAVAMVEGGHHRDGAVGGRGQPRLVTPAGQGRIGQAVPAGGHRPTQRHEHQIIGHVVRPGPREPEGGDGAGDQVGVVLLEGLVVETARRGVGHAQGVHEHVSRGDQPVQRLVVPGVDDHRALAHVEVPLGQAGLDVTLATIDVGALVATKAPLGRLHHDHVGTQAGQDAPAVVHRLVHQLDHAHPVEGPGHWSAPDSRQARDGGLVQLEQLPEDVVAVLVDAGRCPMQAATGRCRRDGQLEGHALQGQVAHLVVGQRDEVPPGRQLGIAFQPVGRVLHRAGRHPSALEQVHDLVAVAGRGPRLDQLVQLVGVLPPIGQGGEARVGPPLGMAGHLEEGQPLVLGATRDDHPTIAARLAVGALVVGRPVRPLGTPVATVAGGEVRSPGRASVHRSVEQERTGQRRGRLELGHVHVLALTGATSMGQTGQDPDRAEVAAHVVEVAERPPGRFATRHPDHVGEPGEGLGGRPHGHEVVVRSRVAVAAHRDIDDVTLELAEALVAEPPSGQRAGREALGDHVALLDEPLEHGQALGVAGVDRDRALSAGVVLVEDAAPVQAAHLVGVGQGGTPEPLPLLARLGDERRHDPDGVGPHRRLHSDDVGAQAPQYLGGLRTEPKPAEVEDAHAVQRHRTHHPSGAIPHAGE